MPNANGDPIGIDVDPAPKPVLPDAGRVLSGSLCRLEALSAEAHAVDLFESFSLDLSDSLWTYLPQGPFQSVDEFSTWVQRVALPFEPPITKIKCVFHHQVHRLSGDGLSLHQWREG